MPRNRYDNDGNDRPARPRRPRGPLGPLFGGLAVLAALAVGGWAFHHYHPEQFGKIFSLPGQNPVIQRKDAEERWLYVTPSPARNAKINALVVTVLQLRPLAGQTVTTSGGGPPLEMADMQVQFRNPTNHVIDMGSALYFATSCDTLSGHQSGYTLGTPTWLPATDTMWSVSHNLPGGTQNPGNLYLALNPHQTKVGWAGIFYTTRCVHHLPDLVISDSAPLTIGQSVTRKFELPPLGPPISPPVSGD